MIFLLKPCSSSDINDAILDFRITKHNSLTHLKPSLSYQTSHVPNEKPPHSQAKLPSYSHSKPYHSRIYFSALQNDKQQRISSSSLTYYIYTYFIHYKNYKQNKLKRNIQHLCYTSLQRSKNQDDAPLGSWTAASGLRLSNESVFIS